MKTSKRCLTMGYTILEIAQELRLFHPTALNVGLEYTDREKTTCNCKKI